MPELNIIFPESLDLSLAAIGVLSTIPKKIIAP